MRNSYRKIARQVSIGAITLLALCACGGGGGTDGGSTPPGPPVAGRDTATTFEGQPVTINVLANDSDPAGLPLSVGVSVPAVS